jgi:hypothetical protein
MPDDVLLVLLGGRPCSVYELRHRHAEVFGEAGALAINRVQAAVNRLVRAGYVQVNVTAATVATPRFPTNRPICALTAAGERRARTWLPAVTADTDPDDVHARGVLAVEAADPDTFARFVDAALAATAVRGRALAAAAATGPVHERARAAFEEERAGALVRWLRRLPQHRP